MPRRELGANPQGPEREGTWKHFRAEAAHDSPGHLQSPMLGQKMLMSRHSLNAC